jgi:predicted ATPase
LRGDIETGYHFGRLALRLQERYSTPASRSSVLVLTNMVILWKEHLRHTLPGLLEAHYTALETGDLFIAAVGALQYCFRALAIGKNLVELEQDMAKYAVVMQQLKQIINLHYHRIGWQFVVNLTSRVPDPAQLSGEQFDEATRTQLLEIGDPITLSWLHLCNLMLAYLFRQWPQAVEQAVMAAQHLGNAPTSIDNTLFHFYDSLARLAVYNDVTETDQQLILEKVAANQHKLKGWADHAPMNFSHKYAGLRSGRSGQGIL